MRKKIIVIFASVLLLALVGVRAVYAQEDPGYPVESETPTETETPAETEAPTAAPTEEPTVDPTEAPPETEIPTEVPTEIPTETPVEENPVCLFTRVHPVLSGLATRYAVPYEDVVNLFCSADMGVGEVALALATVQQSDGAVTLEDLLSQRLEDGLGWGEIWQDLGMTGNPDNHGLGNTELKKVADRNEFQDRIQNEGEDDQIQNEAEYLVQNGQRPETPPGQIDKEDQGQGAGKPETPPGQVDDGDGEGVVPTEDPLGQAGDSDPGNGNNSGTPPGQGGENPGNGNGSGTSPGQGGGNSGNGNNKP